VHVRDEFAIKYGAFRLLLSVLGLGPRFSRVVVDADRLTVKMGWGFSADVPRSVIASAQRSRGPVGGIGVHGWRGRWLVNGAASGLVIIRLGMPRLAHPTSRLSLNDIAVILPA